MIGPGGVVPGIQGGNGPLEIDQKHGLPIGSPIAVVLEANARLVSRRLAVTLDDDAVESGEAVSVPQTRKLQLHNERMTEWRRKTWADVYTFLFARNSLRHLVASFERVLLPCPSSLTA